MAYLSYDALTWAWQTGTFGNDRLQTFFAGGGADPADSDPEAIPAYLQSLVAGVDVVFLMQPGDTVQKIELFDAGGTASGDGNAPLELYVRYAGSSAWQRPALQTFDGSQYGSWRDIGAQEVVTAFRVRCVGKKATWFKRIRLSGTQGYVPKTPVARPGRLDNKNAVNSYWYNIFDPSDVHGPPPQADLDQLRQYSGWRFYLPQQDITDDDRTVRMYSARSGGAHYVELAQLLVQEGKFGVYSFMGNSRQNIATWTYTDSNGTVKTDGDLGSNAVWAKGANLYDPETYRHFGEFGWDMGAMFGNVAYPTDQLRQATQPLNSYDPTPVVYTGLNLFGPNKITPQFGNELSKTWKHTIYPDGQELNAYLPPDAAAIAYAVWRDGYNGTMGSRVGICAADPAIQPTIGILFTADPGYLHAFAEKLREIYGSNADGSVKNFPLAADVHEYARDPQTGAGLPFSQSPLPGRFAALTRVLDLVSPTSTLVLSEYGYARTNAAAGNVDSGAYVSTGYSYLPPTAALTDAQVRRAAVLVDSVIELADLGVGQAYTYDDNHGFKTGTQDILWDQICDMNGEPAQAWLNRLDQVAAGYTRTSSTRQSGGLIAHYAKSGASELVVMTAGATALALTTATSVQAYDLATGTLGTAQAIKAGGSYTRTASEAPTVLLLSTSSTTAPGTGSGGTGSGGSTPPPANATMILQGREPEGSGADPDALSKTNTAAQAVQGPVSFLQTLGLLDFTASAAVARFRQYSSLAAYVDSLVPGAQPWAAGKQKAGSLVYNDSAVWRVVTDIANSQTGPTQAAGSTQDYEFVGASALLPLAQAVPGGAYTPTADNLLLTQRNLDNFDDYYQREVFHGQFLGPFKTGLNVRPFDFILTPDTPAKLRYSKTSFVTGSTYGASAWYDFPGIGGPDLRANLFTPAWQAKHFYPANAETIRPDGLARIAAKADFTSGSAYDESKWNVVDGVLTPAQVTSLLPLAANATVYAAGNKLTPYDTLDQALAAAGYQVTLRNTSFTLTASNSTATDKPRLIEAQGADIKVPAGVTFSYRGYLRNGYLSGAGSLALINPALNSESDVFYGAGLFESEVLGLSVVVPAGCAGVIRSSYVEKLVGAGTVYLYEDTVVITIDRSQGLTVVDRRPTASGGGGGYTLPQATATQLGGIMLGQNLSYNSSTGKVDAAGGGGGIDYANPIAHTASATLVASDANKLHVLSGADFTLTLPASPAASYRLRIKVDSAAAGLYTIDGNGNSIGGSGKRLLVFSESLELLWVGSAWLILSQDATKAEYRLESTPGDNVQLPNDASGSPAFNRQPLTSAAFELNPNDSRQIRCRRPAAVDVYYSLTLANLSPSGFYQPVVEIFRAATGQKELLAIGFVGLGTAGGVTYGGYGIKCPVVVAPGDVILPSIAASGGGNYRADAPTPAILHVSER